MTGPAIASAETRCKSWRNAKVRARSELNLIFLSPQAKRDLRLHLALYFFGARFWGWDEVLCLTLGLFCLTLGL